MGSYHFSTITDIHIVPEPHNIDVKTNRFIYKKADWSKFLYMSEKAFNK